MIISTIKTIGLFTAFFLFLCINIKSKPLFSYIYQTVSPGTTYIQNKAENLIHKGLSSTQSYTKRIFNNSVPKAQDSVSLKLSSIKKNNEGVPNEEIKKEEKEALDQLINNF